jgi:hypothetical protein
LFVPETDPIAERQEQVLGEFAEWLHAAGREAHQRLMASETADDFATYNNALHKLGRGLRQTLVLQRRFIDERLKGEAQARLMAEARRPDPVGHKRSRISSAIARVVWNEHEDFDEDEVERFMEDVDDRLLALAGDPAFLDIPGETLIAKLCEEFDLDVPAHIVKALAIVAEADAPRPAVRADTS